MKTKGYVFAAAVAFIAAAIGPVHAAGAPKRGGAVYAACGACHSLEPDLHLTGPSLAGLWGKKAASVADFPRYSKALKAQEFFWDETTLDAWTAKPEAFVSGTSMTFRGIPQKALRGDLVAFLKIAMGPNGAKSVVAKGLIDQQTARGQAPEPLDHAGPAEQVTAIRHCRNTFFVVTADGVERPFWELNLRLKVDSGETGPKGGKPVLTQSGMQGDRASLVFSDPAQIGGFIERKC